jgi:hypothetical protein
MSRMSSSSNAAATPASTTAPLDRDAFLAQAVMLDVVGQQPIVFQRVFVSITGSVNAALFLSYAMACRRNAIDRLRRSKHPLDPSAILWLSMSREDVEASTGLTRHQQDGARRELRELGILQEKRSTTTEIAINLAVLRAKAQEHAELTWRDHFDAQVHIGQSAANEG